MAKFGHPLLVIYMVSRHGSRIEDLLVGSEYDYSLFMSYNMTFELIKHLLLYPVSYGIVPAINQLYLTD